MAVAALCLSLLLLSELGWRASQYNPFVPRAAVYPPAWPVANFLHTDPDLYRVYFPSGDGFDVFLPYKIQMITGYDPLYPAQFKQLVEAGSQSLTSDSPLWPYGMSPLLLNLLNTKYVINEFAFSADTLRVFQLKQVYSDGKDWIYLNQAALPRAYMAYQCASLTGEAVLTQIKQGVLPITAEVAIESNPSLCAQLATHPVHAVSSNGVQIVSYNNNRVQLEVSIPQAGLLVLGDSFNPDWKALVNGKQQPVLKTNFNFRSVYLPTAGTYAVEFVYTSNAFVWGVAATATGLLICLSLFVLGVVPWQKWRSRGKRG